MLQNGWLVLKKYDSELALEYCRRAKNLAQEQGQSLIWQICDVCIEDALGIYYLGALGEEYYYPVLHAYEKAVQLLKMEGDTSNYAAYLTRYIDLYRLRGTPDSTQLFLNELKGIYQHYTDYRLEASLHTLQSVYAYFKEDMDAVYENLRAAQKRSRELELPRLTQHYYVRLHSYYRYLKQYDRAIEMLDSAVATYHVDHMHADGLDLYYDTYKEAGKTIKALEYLEKWHNNDDWKRKNEKVDLITEWETKYKTQEKEVQLFRERTQRYWLLAFLGVLCLFSLFLVRAYRQQKRIGSKLVHQKRIIEQQAEELQKLDKIKSRFFANVSHELRTPLTLILGPITSILKRADINNRDFTLLKLVQNNGNQLLKLVNSILNLSHLESGTLELKEEAVKFYPLLRRIFSQFESSAQIKGVEMIIDYQLNPYLKIRIDVSKFETILNNLLSNALKFTPRGGNIRLTSRDLGNRIGLKVADTGSGIHPNDLPHVFDRFYQTKQPNAPTEGGSGIGLALSKELAQLFHGDLKVKSILGSGSTFYFEFPKKEVLGFVKEETGDADAVAHSDSFAIESLSTSAVVDKVPIEAQASILLVEDNPSLRQYLQLILNNKFQLSIAENGKVAMEVLAKLPNCQLIISDVMMPVMDGYQLLEKLKSDERWRSIPVVMLTARAALDDKLKALRIGVDDYMLKPFEEEELIVRIENLLSNRQERQKQIAESPKTLQGEATAPVSQVDLEWLKKVEQAMQAQINNSQFTIDQLAHSLFISERQFSRKIKKLTGLTPNKYIREIKLQKARALLEMRRYNTVSETCLAVGFSKAEYFSQLYKKRFGKLPSSYFV